MICHAKLPLTVPILVLKKEVKSINECWYPHLNTFDYQGSWEVLSLRSPGGKSKAINAEIIDGNDFADTPLMKKCPAIKYLVGSLNCTVMSVRLLNLKSEAIIKPHRDHELAFEKGEVRIHIPIFTNNKVEFHLNDNLIPMNEGECWYINANIKHSVINRGTSDRIHLVIDCKVNDSIIELFKYAIKCEIEEEYNISEKVLIIESLRLQKNYAAIKLANDMEEELEAFIKTKSRI